MKDASIESVCESLKNGACFSKRAGGVGISVHNAHAANSYTRATASYTRHQRVAVAALEAPVGGLQAVAARDSHAR